MPQALSGYAERICIIFSPESVCNHHALLPPLCDDCVTILLPLKRKTDQLSNRGGENVILVTAEEALVFDSRGDVKNILALSEIDAGEVFILAFLFRLFQSLGGGGSWSSAGAIVIHVRLHEKEGV